MLNFERSNEGGGGDDVDCTNRERPPTRKKRERVRERDEGRERDEEWSKAGISDVASQAHRNK
jgi:hypothetical protein